VTLEGRPPGPPWGASSCTAEEDEEELEEMPARLLSTSTLTSRGTGVGEGIVSFFRKKYAENRNQTMVVCCEHGGLGRKDEESCVRGSTSTIHAILAVKRE
jgi:hypothetical protein